jgi:hypothetical protein
MTLEQVKNWRPKESFSPSAMSRFTACPRSWAYGYLFGLWSRKKSKAAMLGSLIHACLESYLRGESVYALRIDEKLYKEMSAFTEVEQRDMIAAAPERAIAGLHLLPKLEECEQVEIEKWINIDTRKIDPDIEPLKLSGKIDLSFKRAGQWYVVDHKSTKDFKYQKKGKDLDNDPQAIFYPLDRMLKYGLGEIWCRWPYYLTDLSKRPKADKTDVLFTLEGRLLQARSWLRVADGMRQWVRAVNAGSVTSIDQVPFPPNVSCVETTPCNDYGGCPYNVRKGGPCNPPTQQMGNLIMASALAAPRKQPKGKEQSMDLNQLVAQHGGNVATQPTAQPQATTPLAASPPNVPQSPLLPPEAHQVNGAAVLQQASAAVPMPQPATGAPSPVEPTPPVVETVATPAPAKGRGRPKETKLDKAIKAFEKARDKLFAAQEAAGVPVGVEASSTDEAASIKRPAPQQAFIQLEYPSKGSIRVEVNDLAAKESLTELAFRLI